MRRWFYALLLLVVCLAYFWFREETSRISKNMTQSEVRNVLVGAWHIDTCESKSKAGGVRELYWYGNKDLSNPQLFVVTYEKNLEGSLIVVSSAWEEEYLITWFDGDCTALDFTRLYEKYDRTPIP